MAQSIGEQLILAQEREAAERVANAFDEALAASLEAVGATTS